MTRLSSARIIGSLAILIAATAVLIGCARVDGASAIRHRLAADAELQLDTTATEVEALINYALTAEADRAFAALAAEYDSAFKFAQGDAAMVARASAAYFEGKARTEAALQAEGQRLGLIARKVRGGADAVRTVSEMADAEMAVQTAFADLVTSEQIATLIDRIIEQAETRARPAVLRLN